MSVTIASHTIASLVKTKLAIVWAPRQWAGSSLVFIHVHSSFQSLLKIFKLARPEHDYQKRSGFRNKRERKDFFSSHFVFAFFFFSLVPSQTPPNIFVQSTSSTTIDVSWQPIDQAYVHGILQGYEVRFAKDDGLSLLWESRHVHPNVRKIILRGLWYYSKYKIVVCAKTSKGCGKEYHAISYTWDDGKLSESICTTKILLSNVPAIVPRSSICWM